MFEKLVVDLLNRVLGDYIENLDVSQLNLSLWRGDVRLENLQVKGNALKELEVPVEVKQGRVGSLVLKIPWKNLYTEPTVAEVQDLQLLAVPATSLRYDPDRQKRFDFEAKMKVVRQHEEAKAKAALAASAADGSGSVDVGFLEKLVLQVIKNLQVSVKNLHVRYEDRVTCPDQPFAAGACLRQFSFRTTTEDWRPTTVRETVTRVFYKLLDLQQLSVYCNSFGGATAEEVTRSFISDMPGTDDKTQLQARMDEVFDNSSGQLQYFLEPISAQARFRYDAFPEASGHTRPQIWLDLDFKQLAVRLSKRQYTTLVVFGDSLDRIVTMSKYRQYRQRAGGERLTSREKWLFANAVVLGEVVRRRRRMWSWSRMRQHRRNCRQYADAYRRKLLGYATGDDVLNSLEWRLDAFNIILCRQLAEGMVKKELASRKAEESSWGWFSGWWGSSKRQQQQQQQQQQRQQQQADSLLASVQQEFDKLSPEERAKVYQAVSYQADRNASFPRDYRAKLLNFALGSFTCQLHNEGQQVLQFELHSVTAEAGQFPGSDCLQVKTDIGSLWLWGCESAASSRACIVRTLGEDSADRLLQLQFEQNPFDVNSEASKKLPVDNRIRLVANALEIVYDSASVLSVSDFVQPSQELKFRELSAVVSSQLDSVREMTATGLRHVIEQRSYTEVSVDLRPSHVILAESGRYAGDESQRLLVFELGHLTVRTDPPPDKAKLEAFAVAPDSPGGGDMLRHKSLDFDQLKAIAYDCLQVRLSSVQLLLSDRGRGWREMSEAAASGHILRPLALQFQLYKCMVARDARLPKAKVVGELPTLRLEMSEAKARHLLELIKSVDFPNRTSPQQDSAKSRFEYVRKFELADQLLPQCWLVVRVDGKGFHKFSERHGFEKPNDRRSLGLMTRAAKCVMRNLKCVQLAYGQSDEYSFVLHRDTSAYKRRASKLSSLVCSHFTSAFVFHWPEFFAEPRPQYPPAFDSRVVAYPTVRTLRDYLSWRQADCHVNNLYNTAFWALVLRAGATPAAAEERLRGTLAADKNELLFSQFGVNYNDEPQLFRKGSLLVRRGLLEDPPASSDDADDNADAEAAAGDSQEPVLLHLDIIRDSFWQQNPAILAE